MSSGLFLIAERVLTTEGDEGLRRWEANLTPEQRQWVDDDWREFTAALGEVAKAAGKASADLRRITAPHKT